MHLSGTELHRFAVVQHTGESTTSGHYTSTVSTQTSAFHCNDSTVTERPDLFADDWSNAFMIFYERRLSDIVSQRGESPPAPNNIVTIESDQDQHFDQRGDSHPSRNNLLIRDAEKEETKAGDVLDECGNLHPVPVATVSFAESGTQSKCAFTMVVCGPAISPICLYLFRPIYLYLFHRHHYHYT